MVLAVERKDDDVEVLVAPVTTKPPLGRDGSVEMPAAVRGHLGLDGERCWRQESELSPYCGKVPGKLLERVREAMTSHIAADRLRITKRGE